MTPDTTTPNDEQRKRGLIFFWKGGNPPRRYTARGFYVQTLDGRFLIVQDDIDGEVWIPTADLISVDPYRPFAPKGGERR